MSDDVKLMLLWIGIPILGVLVSCVGLLISCILGYLATHNKKNKEKGVYMIRGFKEVKEEFKKTEGSPILPTRATKKAMAYDFYANKDYEVKPNEVCKIWTDIKAYMQENEGLILNVRSSMGGKFMLANSQGWIDARG